jgi:radical SAM protein with 4Fe4S-binding SPASM domain
VLKNLTYLMEKSRTNSNIHLDIHDISAYQGVDAQSSLDRMIELFPENLSRRIRFDSRKFHNFCGHLDFTKNEDSYRMCPYPWTQMAVTYSGDCVPCCRDTAARSVLGNLLLDDVNEIWNNEKYQQFRENLINHHPELNAACENCDLPYSAEDNRWKLSYAARSLLGR